MFIKSVDSFLLIEAGVLEKKIDFISKYIPMCKPKLTELLVLGFQVQKSAIKGKGTEVYFTLTILCCQRART